MTVSGHLDTKTQGDSVSLTYINITYININLFQIETSKDVPVLFSTELSF